MALNSHWTNPPRVSTSVSLWDSFPRELWLITFQFLSPRDLVHAFHPLNNYFLGLLAGHFQQQAVDLQFTHEADFQHLCQYYAPWLRSLRLCQGIDYPSQTEAFLLRNLPLDNFTSLQTFSLSHIKSYVIWERVLAHIDRSLDLTHLSICQFEISLTTVHLTSIFDTVWRLPKLIYFRLNLGQANATHRIPALHRTSTSLRRVELHCLSCQPNDLFTLLQHTLCLENVALEFVCSSGKPLGSIVFQTITKLSLSCSIVWDRLTDVLKSMPRLAHLKLNANLGLSADGHQWRNFIVEYLPCLEKFHFVIKYDTFDRHHLDEQVRRLVDSFNNDFWLREHHWCVRCDWQALQPQNLVRLYTLPYMYNQLYDWNPRVDLQSRTTCADHQSYDCVRSLNYDYLPKIHPEALTIGFNKLHSLVVTLPTTAYFQTTVPSFGQLKQLELRLETDEINASLLNLLNTAPHLRRLALMQWPSATSLGLLEYLSNRSIRQLDLCGFSSTDSPQYFDGVRCEELSRTSLAAQCEELTIRVEAREDILRLLASLKRLRLLVVKVADDPHIGTADCSHLPDIWLAWVQSHLPLDCVVLREECTFGKIRIWIRERDVDHSILL